MKLRTSHFLVVVVALFTTLTMAVMHSSSARASSKLQPVELVTTPVFAIRCLGDVIALQRGPPLAIYIGQVTSLGAQRDTGGDERDSMLDLIAGARSSRLTLLRSASDQVIYEGPLRVFGLNGSSKTDTGTQPAGFNLELWINNSSGSRQRNDAVDKIAIMLSLSENGRGVRETVHVTTQRPVSGRSFNIVIGGDDSSIVFGRYRGDGEAGSSAWRRIYERAITALLLDLSGPAGRRCLIDPNFDPIAEAWPMLTASQRYDAASAALYKGGYLTRPTLNTFDFARLSEALADNSLAADFNSPPTVEQIRAIVRGARAPTDMSQNFLLDDALTLAENQTNGATTALTRGTSVASVTVLGRTSINRGSLGFAQGCLLFSGTISNGTNIVVFDGQWASCRIGGVPFVSQIVSAPVAPTRTSAPIGPSPRNRNIRPRTKR